MQQTASMLVAAISSLFSAYLLYSARVSADDAASHVVKLTTATFPDFVNSSNVTLVEFFAPWCGHCKQLAPEYEQAAITLKEEGVRLASVDCVNEADFCEKEQIRGYPTLRVYRKGEHSNYEGPRKADGIHKFMVKQTKPAVSTIALQSFGNFTQSDDVVVVGLFKKDWPEAETFAKVAEKFRNEYSFGSLETPSVVLFKKFDEGYSVFDGEKFDQESLTAFVNRESTPLVAEIGPNNYAKYMDAGIPLAYFFYGSDEQKAQYAQIVESAIREVKGKINAVYINATQFGQHAEILNLEKKWPGFVIHDMGKEWKYPFPQKDAITKESLTMFVKSFVGGELKPTFKSEAIPEKNDTPVKVVVHDSFEKVVMDEKKDVLLEIYAPWCGACKNLAPTYEKLAAKYAAHSDKIVISKFDGIANDLPASVDFKLEAFPTIKLFKAGSKQVVDYEGGHSLNAFIDFISKHATNKVEVAKEDTKDSADSKSAGAHDDAGDEEPEEPGDDDAHDEL